MKRMIIFNVCVFFLMNVNANYALASRNEICSATNMANSATQISTDNIVKIEANYDQQVLSKRQNVSKSASTTGGIITTETTEVEFGSTMVRLTSVENANCETSTSKGTYRWEAYGWNGGTNWYKYVINNNKNYLNLSIPMTDDLTFVRICETPCGDLYSNEVKIKVKRDFDAGLIHAVNNKMCYNEDFTTITSEEPVKGGDGNYSYQWQYCTKENPTWTNIDGATEETYTPTMYIANCGYRRLVKDGTMENFVESDGIYWLEINLPIPEMYSIPGSWDYYASEYIWTGASKENPNDWSDPTNWLYFDHLNNSSYTVASQPPSGKYNVLIPDYTAPAYSDNECFSNENQPVIESSAEFYRLWLNTNRTLTFSDEAIVTANGAIENKGTMHLNGGTLVFKSAVHQNGVFKSENATLVAAGNKCALGFGWSGITVKNFIANMPNKSSRLELNNYNGSNKALEVREKAEFISGIVVPKHGNADTYIIFGKNAVVSSCENSYTTTYVTKKEGGSNFTFPVGSTKLYAPVKANVSGDVSVVYKYSEEGTVLEDINPFNVGEKINHASSRENWSFYGTEGASLSKITLYWYDKQSSHLYSGYSGAEIPFKTVKENLLICYYDMNGENPRWERQHPTPDISGNINVGSINIPNNINIGNNNFIITFASKSPDLPLAKKGSGGLAPIELISFEGVCNGKSADLSWATATEKNNEWFVVEKSADAINFTEIARIAGAGNSIEELHYSYTDNNVLAGNNFYRLRQIDYDGMSTTSDIISLVCKDEAGNGSLNPTITAYPNPFNNEISIVTENIDEEYSIQIYNNLGQMVYYKEKVQNAYQQLNLSDLPKGNYLVRIITAQKTLKKSIIKQ